MVEFSGKCGKYAVLDTPFQALYEEMVRFGAFLAKKGPFWDPRFDPFLARFDPFWGHFDPLSGVLLAARTPFSCRK